LQPAVSFVQPVTGFQVVSVHSISDACAISPPFEEVFRDAERDRRPFLVR